ncbi:MAG TPA: TetR/AcrR family transcriptional regulator [Streptosporangiaceae bacterium]|nr:TetR/AcrR family transcriptional regulator [Streptosporangiaceae bacterium]
MRTREGGSGSRPGTFTQARRRDQLVDCAIGAIAELGFARASVAEVARRAGVSKGVVTYHFPAKDDLIGAVIGDVIGSMAEHLSARLAAAQPETFPERFVAAYIGAWVEYYRGHARELFALVSIYNTFRDEAGRWHPAFAVRADEVAAAAEVLALGQTTGKLGSFDTSVMAAVMKAALDDLLTQFADNPGLDLDAYGAELTVLFQRATGPDPQHDEGCDGDEAVIHPHPAQAATTQEER